MGRAPCCDKANVKKGPWSPEEDAKLKSYIDQHGTGGNWIALPQKIGLKRCGKSCRLRWLNYLRPNIKHGGFSEEEDNIICNLYISIGSRWSIIAAQLPGRTDNDIKNYWNTRLKKKLLGRQRKEQAMAAHQARRRRPNNFSPKQEIIMKREIANSQGSPNFDDDNTSPIIDHHHHHLQSRFASSYHVMSQADHQAPNYWPPELPLAMPAAQESDQQASLKNLLAKLGGRFSEGSATACNYAFPAADHDHHLMVSSAQDQAYQASKFDVLTSSTSLYGGGESSFQLGLENLQAELSELINYSNYQQADDQLVGDYGANYSGGFTSANSTTSLDSSSSSLVNYHSNNMVSDHHYSQFHQDNSAFDQVSSCYFGSAYDNITI